MNGDESVMRKSDLDAMELDELWLLHEELTKILAEKISTEKRKLERRLTQLSRTESPAGPARPRRNKLADKPRRKYPKVLPKYFNPSAPTEMWSGRGKQPRWFVAALRSGYKLEDLRIPASKEASGNADRQGQRY